jgi:uncharacterized protein (DUF305 family)
MRNRLTRSAGPVRGLVAVLLVSAVMPGSGCAPKAAAGVPYDLQFIDTMTAHHQGAIEMARAAEAKAMHVELLDFARQVIADQQREVTQMELWRAQWFPGRARAVNMAMPGMAESMKGMDAGHLQMLAGAEFDRMFVEMMIPHHEGALAMSQEALEKAERPEIRALAAEIIAAQQREIEMMTRWQEAWRAR